MDFTKFLKTCFYGTPRRVDWIGLPDQSAWKDIDAESVQKDFVILTASFRGFAEISCAGFNFAIALIDLEQQNAYK